MRKISRVFMLLSACSLVMVSCNNDDDNTTEQPTPGAYENGIIVSSQGSGSISGTIDFITDDFTTVDNGIYSTVNNEDLGTYLQSVAFDDDMAYIVVDNASTITVVNRNTFEKVGAITTGLNLPRYMDEEDGKGYVTNWGDPYDSTDDFVAVVDLESLTVETTIAVAEGPEQILVEDGKIFVTHSGGYSTNNVVSVISLSDYAVSTIEVNDIPNEIAVNNAGELVVLSHGATIYDENWTPVGDTPGAITKINTADNSIIATLEFAEGNHPSLMDYEDGVLYYQLNGNVYTVADADTTLPETALLNLGSIYAYGLAVDDNQLFVTNASFTALSDLIVYDLTTLSQTNTFSVGVGASNIYFN